MWHFASLNVLTEIIYIKKHIQGIFMLHTGLLTYFLTELSLISISDHNKDHGVPFQMSTP